MSGSWVLLPPRPVAMVHFLGGAFVATAPHLTYRALLEALARAGYGVIATPFVNTTFNHRAIARDVLNRFETILQRLQRAGQLRTASLPVYGLGHSLGCKLHLLIGSLYGAERAGNMLVAYNNYPLRQAIPFGDRLNLPLVAEDLEFVPSPSETHKLVVSEYQVRRNLLIKFRRDEIDQTLDLAPLLTQRFPTLTAVQTLPGNHLTPVAQELDWQAGEAFSPLDALGQWMKQEFYRDLHGLQRELLRWLEPTTVR